MIRYWQRHPDTGGNYGRSKGQQFFDNMRGNWERRTHKDAGSQPRKEEPTRRETDEQYNVRKQREQDEIDIILDKIRKSGYDSLTKEEKRKLFDAGNKK